MCVRLIWVFSRFNLRLESGKLQVYDRFPGFKDKPGSTHLLEHEKPYSVVGEGINLGAKRQLH
jgi:hypothetical protein